MRGPEKHSVRLGMSPLIDALVSTDEAARVSALGALSDIAADSFGEDAANLAALLRNAGGMAVLVAFMQADKVDVQQCAMSLIGNLLTDVFDHEARASLQLFSDAGGLSELHSKLSADYPINLFAAAAMQNVTALDPQECCAALRELAVDATLTELTKSDNEQVRRPLTLPSFSEYNCPSKLF
jgi:hypothetical protein